MNGRRRCGISLGEPPTWNADHVRLRLRWCAVLVSRLGCFGTTGQSSTPSKNAQLVTENGASVRLNIASLSLASELQNHEIEANTHDVKKGTLFDDESFIVRQGTEPNLLIAKAAGLEAFIPNGDAASLQAGQIQE